jgi:hypothetical protein
MEPALTVGIVSAPGEARTHERRVGRVEGPVGRRIRTDGFVVAEWTCDYGDGRLYRNVAIGELRDGKAIRVTDYWGEPVATPEWRRPPTAPLQMPGDGIWPDHDHLEDH